MALASQQLTRDDRVHALVQTMQAAGVDALLHAALAQAQRGQLGHRKHAVLASRDLREGMVEIAY